MIKIPVKSLIPLKVELVSDGKSTDSFATWQVAE